MCEPGLYNSQSAFCTSWGSALQDHVKSVDAQVSSDNKHSIPLPCFGCPVPPKSDGGWTGFHGVNVTVEQSVTDASEECSPKMASPFCVLPVRDVEELVLSMVML